MERKRIALGAAAEPASVPVAVRAADVNSARGQRHIVLHSVRGRLRPVPAPFLKIRKSREREIRNPRAPVLKDVVQIAVRDCSAQTLLHVAPVAQLIRKPAAVFPRAGNPLLKLRTDIRRELSRVKAARQ